MILVPSRQALKVLKTAEFMPYVVFIAAPDFDTLKGMHKAVVDAGITTKQLTVGDRGDKTRTHSRGDKGLHSQYIICMYVLSSI